MSDPIYTTETGKSPRRASTQLVASDVPTIVLCPDLEMVIIGGHHVRAFDMSVDQGSGEADGYITYFKVEGLTHVYDVWLYEDHAEVSKWWSKRGEPLSTLSDHIEFTSVTAFAYFALKVLVPDWQSSLLGQLTEEM